MPDEAWKREGMEEEELVVIKSNAMKDIFTLSPAMVNRGGEVEEVEEVEEEEEEEERGEISLCTIEVFECD